MEIHELNAFVIRKCFLAAANELASKKEWINELNVFPVPDGDTGTNMTMTMMSAAKEVAALETDDMKVLCKAIASGSLRGARGNSGVILSQLFRGFTRELAAAEKSTVEIPLLAAAFVRATETAYKAVMKPKEGTILTVARAMSDKAEELQNGATDIIAFAKDIIAAGDAALEQTPELLPVLKQAGVVDSGGQGLMTVMHGAFQALSGEIGEVFLENFDAAQASESREAHPIDTSHLDTSEIRFGYCTEFIVNLEHPLSDDEEQAFKSFLESIGDSIVCVASEDMVKVHVHTNDPGLAIQKGLSMGSLSRMKIDNMREEHKERLIRNASQLAAEEKRKQAASAETLRFPECLRGRRSGPDFQGNRRRSVDFRRSDDESQHRRHSERHRSNQRGHDFHSPEQQKHHSRGAAGARSDRREECRGGTDPQYSRGHHRNGKFPPGEQPGGESGRNAGGHSTSRDGRSHLCGA